MKNFLKNLTCFLLCLAMLTPVTLSVNAKEEQGLSVYVVSDPHYRPYSTLLPLSEMNTLLGDPLYHHVNNKSMLTYEADAIIDEFLARFEASDAKYLLIPGDLSEDGYWEEHQAFAQKLREFKQRTGKKIFVLNGNHDIRTSASDNRLNLEDFLEIYADIGYDEALARHEGSASYTADLDNDYRLVAIDACIYREDGSHMSPDLCAWVEQQVLTARKDGKKLIGMVHHSVLPHLGIQSVTGNMLNLENYRERANDFADWGIKYIFTGHGHANDITTAISKKGNRIVDIETGSLITYPNAYRIATFTDECVKIKTDYIDKINIELLPEGFNEQQKYLMTTNFKKYSYGYFKAGYISYENEIPFAINRLSRFLKVKEGTTSYEALTTVMTTVGEALKLPLYDLNRTSEIDSAQEIAKLAGISLEESNYKNAFEIIGAIYAEHYEGDEDLTVDSLEVRLFNQCVNAALVYSMANLPVKTINAFMSTMRIKVPVNGLLDSLYTKAANQVYAQNAAKIVFQEMIQPLVMSIIKDSFAPGDLNVTLEPYSEHWDVEGTHAMITETTYFGRIIISLINSILNSFKAFWRYVIPIQ